MQLESIEQTLEQIQQTLVILLGRTRKTVVIPDEPKVKKQKLR